jgi:ABC-type multidrug transport system fused ATPase/permease subunit
MVMNKKAPNKGVNMKQFAKKTLVVTTIALVMSSGATAALAEDASSPSTTVPTASTPKTISAERSAYRTALQAYNKAKIEINKNFATAMKEANTARRTARESATTKEAKKAAQIAFSAAITTAQNARTAALTALGDPPVKPVKTDDSSK